MNKTVKVTTREKRIILMGLFDLGVMLARVSGRLHSVNKMNDEESDTVRENTMNIQSLIASILEANSDDLSEAMEMSQMIDNDIASIVNKLSRKLNNNDGGVDLNGLKDLLNL